MKTLRFFIIIVLAFSLSELYAQTYAFKVLASSGKSMSKSTGKQLLVGTKINSSDQINVDAKSYLSLVDMKGGTVQISKAGTYSIKDLEGQLANSKKSVSQKYASYVIGEITKQGDDIAKSRYKYQNVTGSVERETFSSNLVVMLPKKELLVAGSEYFIKWHPLAGTKTYKVNLKDHFDEDIANYETTDTTFKINMKDARLSGADIVQITVLSKERPEIKSTTFGLTRIEGEKDKYSKFKASLKSFETENVALESGNAFEKLNRAFFFEENGLIVDALKFYEEAYQLDPRSEALETAYKQFLVRRNIGNVEEIKKSEKDQ